ncbi:CDP-glycerol glycerophosphotransferase family protein [Flexivirga oryzae]|uniref:Glycosyltransferase involved in cell wall biosynthesis n=1 Tax=Flexivirga oryzae TaxID=1794944 RepID=A0A839NH79_9MICO|nr:glycosyltransferase involved in cell wall biosynthesis [Flexivirga oryzae]
MVPLFRTEKYVSELLDCFDAQRPGDYDLEFIFVDDGSDDASGDLAQAWLDRTAADGRVVRQENGGVSRARNTGIGAASGDWVTFPDSDDLLSDDYFAEAAGALRGAGSEAALLSANVWYYDEATGARRNTHHLRHKFYGADGTVDLQHSPTFLQTQAASAFFRLDIIREHDIAFVDGLRVAEDAVFAATYLLHAPNRLMAPLRRSLYYYRRRGDGSSAANSYTTNPDFYFGRFERGYLPLLELARSLGDVPRWLEYLILYDLSWYFPREMERDRKAIHLSDAEKARAVELLQAVLQQISEAAIVNYRLTRVNSEVRALMLTLSGRPLPDAGTVRVSRNIPGAFEICYLYQGELPEELVESDGRPVTPVAAKTRRLDYLGQQLLRERILRLPELTDVGLVLDGRPRPLRDGGYDLGASEVSASGAGPDKGGRPAAPLWRRVAFRGAVELICFTKAPINAPTATRKAVALRRKRYRTALRTLSRTPYFAKRFAGAWLIMDRLGSARDNGEYLYEYLRSERPDINAWFVLQKNSPEWDRLSKQGFRLIAYRSVEHQAALQHAAIVASSQLDVEVIQPIPADFYPGSNRPWRFVYLQHGVLQHDLSHWFNGKSIDLLTTASVDEDESIVADGSSYRLTSDSVVLTGFPRHDDILRAARRHPYDDRSVVLIAPTWRNSLFLPKPSFAARRRLRDPFLQTEYGRNWMGLLRHPALQRLVDEENARIVYLPHPNFRGNTPDVTYPDHVTVIDSTPDLHDLMASARVTVTDYSSIFFDAALAGSRIVYFQFDRAEFLSGSHTYLPGYWDYDEHGFGPVATDLDGAARLTADAYSAQGTQWPQLYRERIERTLPLADGDSARRITELIQTKFGC